MRARTILSVIPIACLAAGALLAQSESSSDVSDAATRVRLKTDLRNLVTAQESYFADHSTYADLIDNLKFRPSNGSQVSLVATQNNAWAAVASDPSWPGKSCIIFVNLAEKYRPKTVQEKRTAADNEEGRPICDGDPKPDK